MRGDREEGMHWLPKRENVTMSSINSVCLSSVKFTGEPGKTGAVLVLCLCGVPFHSSDWASDGEQKQKHFVETRELAQPTALDRFLVILFGPERLIHIFKNCRIRQTMNWGVRFGAVKRNTASYRKLCRHFYHMLNLAVRRIFTALWYKTHSSSSAKSQKQVGQYHYCDYCSRSRH